VASVLPGYLLDVYGKMESFVPDYTPKPGIMLNKPKKWKIKLSDNEVRGRYKRFFPKLELICSYRDVEPTVDELKKVNKSSNKYKVYCYVLPKVNSELRDFASRYQPANFGLFFYDLSSKELIKNNDNKMANFFEGYFKPSKKPARFTEMVIGEAEDGLLTHQQIAKFGKKVPYTLEKLNVVTKMSNDGYFVNECARG
jgi:hypothetical protein